MFPLSLVIPIVMIIRQLTVIFNTWKNYCDEGDNSTIWSIFASAASDCTA